jgi:hypothetical protein
MLYVLAFGGGVAATISAKLAWERYGAPALARLKAKVFD